MILNLKISLGSRNVQDFSVLNLGSFRVINCFRETCIGYLPLARNCVSNWGSGIVLTPRSCGLMGRLDKKNSLRLILWKRCRVCTWKHIPKDTCPSQCIPSSWLQTFASKLEREGPHWLTWLIFRSSHHHTSFNSRICFPCICFIPTNWFQYFPGAV